MATQTWTEQLIVHLELAKQVAGRLPANERLEVDKLNKVLELLVEVRGLFLMQCQLQGMRCELQGLVPPTSKKDPED